MAIGSTRAARGTRTSPQPRGANRATGHAPGIPVGLVTPEEFLRAPVGSATASEHALFWLPTRDLLLISVWGRLGLADYELFERLAWVWLAPDAPWRRSVLDMRGLVGVEPEAMERFATFTVNNRARYLDTLGECGLVVERTAVLTAAAVAGLPTVADARSPFRIYTSPHEVLAAFHLDASALAAAFDALRQQAVAQSELLGVLCPWLRENLTDGTLARAARALAMSPRTLQRRLEALGTTFRREQERARVQEVQRLLEDTEDKVYTIGLAVGLQKAQHLAALFRRWTGVGPSAWRAARRAHSRPPG